MYRGHEPVVINELKGLWDQGDPEEVPLDHLSDCNNIHFDASGNLSTRPGVDRHQNVAVPLGNVVRIYNYLTPTGNTLLALTYDGTTGNVYHVVAGVATLVLTKAGMEDFAFVPWAGRAYISPFKTYSGIEKGLQNEFLYVYDGLGNPAQKAAGAGPPATPAMVVANGAAGNTDAGFHLFAVVFETNTGYLSPAGAFVGFTTSTTLSVSFSSIPISAAANVTKRHIVTTKIIENYNGNTTGYEYYFIPNATVNDNVTTTLSNISFFDQDLLESADYLFDNYAEIPAGCSLSIYHNRLILTTTYDNINLILGSAPGEPEAINQITGVLEAPRDGNPLTLTQELRDVLYVTKRNRTFSYTDNDDDFSSWPLTVVDAGLGAPVHGVATVIDSGSSSVDYLIVATSRGIIIFNGRYQLPELSFKIYNFWLEQDKDLFRRIQIVNDVVNQIIYCTLPDRTMIIGDYNNGLNPMDIRWAPWEFDFKVNTIALINVDELIVASEGGL